MGVQPYGPNVVARQVFPYLDARALGSCYCVCKDWKVLVLEEILEKLKPFFISFCKQPGSVYGQAVDMLHLIKLIPPTLLFSYSPTVEYINAFVARKVLMGGAPDFVGSLRDRAFAVAAEQGDFDIVRRLLKGGPIDVGIRGKAFVRAAEQGKLQMVEALHINGSIPADWHLTAFNSASSMPVLSFLNDGFANTPT